MVLLLLVFVGQVTAASSISCRMDNQGQSVHVGDDQNTDHDMSKMEGFCIQKNNCSMTACLSFTLPSLLSNTISLFSYQEIIAFPVKMAPSQPLTSLYRPPILS